MQTSISNQRTTKAASAGESALELNHFPPRFLQTLGEQLTQCRAQNKQGCLLLVAISNMPMLVSACGHAMSEQVMTALNETISAQLPEGGKIFRIQRDELAILLPNTNNEEIDTLAAGICSHVEDFGRHNTLGSAIHVICSIGSTQFPTDATQVVDVLDQAYLALSSALPNMHRSYQDIAEETEKARQQMGLANYLFRAYNEDRLRLAFQPVINSHDGSIAHYEGLLRLVNPNGQISSAGPLIPVAERMGLIEKIDTMVLELIVRELRQYPNVTLAFNVSNLTTDNAKWLARFNELLAETPEIAPRLVVEITETAAHRDLRKAAYFVAAIQAVGASVALDDFGSGYTSFRQLKSLSVDFVKIDGAFVKDIAQNADSRFFVKTLLEFAHGFGLHAVAEFVENGEIAKILMELGVDYMQGYYFGKPENHRSWVNSGEFSKD